MTDRTGVSIAAGGSIVYSIQLLSGLIGGLQEKCLPIGELVGDLRLELTLAQTTEPFNGANPNWSLTEMELMLETVELSDTATAMVAQHNASGFLCHSTVLLITVRLYQAEHKESTFSSQRDTTF